MYKISKKLNITIIFYRICRLVKYKNPLIVWNRIWLSQRGTDEKQSDKAYLQLKQGMPLAAATAFNIINMGKTTFQLTVKINK